MEEKDNKIENDADAEDKLKECERQKQEYLSGWQRARADFINYKKEEMERIQGFIGYAKEEFILKLLPILDSFDRAETAASSAKDNEHVKGLLGIKDLLLDFLKREGVGEINAINCEFDPNYHEAVAGENNEAEAGTIIEIVQKGYTINGRVLRPTKVKIVK